MRRWLPSGTVGDGKTVAIARENTVTHEARPMGSDSWAGGTEISDYGVLQTVDSGLEAAHYYSRLENHEYAKNSGSNHHLKHYLAFRSCSGAFRFTNEGTAGRNKLRLLICHQMMGCLGYGW
jgi:hypothetical protein